MNDTLPTSSVSKPAGTRHASRAATAAFSGHRTYRHEAHEALRQTVGELSGRGYRYFLCGMAAGFDLAAAEAVIALRTAGADVKLVAVVPFAGQAEKFSEADKVRYDCVLRGADEVLTLASYYTRACYMLRNNYLVDHAAVVVAWYDGSEGGTHHTIHRALKRGVEVVNLCAASAVRSHPQLF